MLYQNREWRGAKPRKEAFRPSAEQAARDTACLPKSITWAVATKKDIRLSRLERGIEERRVRRRYRPVPVRPVRSIALQPLCADGIGGQTVKKRSCVQYEDVHF